MDSTIPRTNRNQYCETITQHYVYCWGNEPSVVQFRGGPIHELPFDFQVLRFAPTDNRKMWTYATVCMSQRSDAEPVELHLFAPGSNDAVAEILVAIAHYHRTGEWLRLGDSVNFGRPWWDGSSCDHGLISLPYLDGPKLEWLLLGETKVRFLWLIPITSAEVVYKKARGLVALERKFDRARLNYVDPLRSSVA